MQETGNGLALAVLNTKWPCGTPDKVSGWRYHRSDRNYALYSVETGGTTQKPTKTHKQTNQKAHQPGCTTPRHGALESHQTDN
ncbi:MAG: hypothetical protein EAY75_02220 [Bacteroidetes bacterium]|nr:MAG: hypothetical protein EAY75_02220 [Bacteroidota bacterium]